MNIEKFPVGDSVSKTNFPGPDGYLKMLEETGTEKYVEAYKKVLHIANKIEEAGGRALLVGGSVRDIFFGKASKDFDLEVYGLEAPALEELVRGVAKTSDVGRAFGILKVDAGDGMDIDVSLPRKDSKVSEGHKGFRVETDPHMSFEEAAKRRDFSMNALSADPLSGELFDYFNGLDDIAKRKLKITDPERFKDDPLRVLRGLQFISRFGLSMDEEDSKLMKELVPSLKELPKERLLEEWKKLLVKGEKPSLGLMAAMQLGVLDEIHPQFPPLAETKQEEKWHPEGDVWMHTLMTVDEAVKICRANNLSEKDSFIIMLSALCHDIGKPEASQVLDGKIVSYGHDKAGIAPSEEFLKDIGVDKETEEKVVKLVSNHMAPTLLYISEIKGDKITDSAIRKLSKRIHPATIEELVMLAEADHLGRGPFESDSVDTNFLNPFKHEAGEWLRKKAEDLNIYREKAEDLIRGKDLLEKGFSKPKNKEDGLGFGKAIELSNRLKALFEELKKELEEEEIEFNKDDYIEIIKDIDSIDLAVKSLKAYGIEVVNKIRRARKNKREGE
jgi:tRNA nucleotidyltransferase (CCA-adding enzyme)